MNEWGSTLGTTATELTVDHMRAFKAAVEREATKPQWPRVCLLCHQFAGERDEMIEHWRVQHGVYPRRMVG